MKQLIYTLTLLASITAALVPAVAEVQPDAPVPVLNLPGSGTDPTAIDYQSLPVLKRTPSSTRRPWVLIRGNQTRSISATCD